MSNIVRRNQSRGMDPWRDFFDMDFFGNNPQRPGQRSLPAVNISEDEKNYIVDVVSPGFKKDDFKIKVDDDILTISAETKQETAEGGNNKEYSRREYTYSSFTRSFQLPDNAKDDSISASYNDGILKITIPKSEQEVKASKEIQVQ